MSRFLSTLLIFQLGIFVTVHAAGTLNFVNPNIKVDEGQGEAVLYIEKIKSDLKASSVNYRIVSSSATLGIDYQVESEGILQWGDSDTNPKNITIKLLDDLDEETNENIVIELFNPSEGVYLGDAVTATVTISGSESGSIGFAIDQYIGSEFDEIIRVLVSRRDGLEGAILVDYEVRELTELPEENVLGGVPHYRKLPESDFLERKEVPGVKAKALSDFIPMSGTLLFLDYQSSATIPVLVTPNFDGNSYPHTVLEVAVNNPRPLTDISQLDDVSVFEETDKAAFDFVAEMKQNPQQFTPERETLVPGIAPDRRLASVRINDISGPGLTQKIWEDENAPDTEPRVGFRFSKARYYTGEGTTIRIPVLRSAPFGREVSVRYMVGPNRGFMVDDPRENWQIEEPKENPLTDSLQNYERLNLSATLNATPYTDTGDQYFGGPIEDIYYARQPGDEPRIRPIALYGSNYYYSSDFYDGVFGDPNQLMHYNLDFAILNPGSDVPTPTGARDKSPSFNKPLSPNDIIRDFKVTTGTLSWQAEDFTEKYIEIEILDDKVLEFNEDIVAVLYEVDYLRTEAGSDTAGENDDNQNPDDPDDPDDPDNPDDDNQLSSLVPGESLGVQFWATVTIQGEGDVAGSVKSDFDANINNDVYDMVVVRKGLDNTSNNNNSREENLIVVGDFTSVSATPRNRIARINSNTGIVDKNFDPGTGADNYINTIKLALYPDTNELGDQIVVAKYMIGGGFTSYNGESRKGICRINPDGSLDETFNPGTGIEDGTVHDIYVTQGNQVIVVGEFTRVNGFKRNGIVRFLETGEVDESFDIGEGPDGPLYAVSQFPDGRVIIGGGFGFIGEIQARSLAVLQSNGSIDSSFVMTDGVIGEIYSLDVLAMGQQNRVVIGGSFSEVKGYEMNNVAVLDSNGNLDESFIVGKGADGPVYSVKVDKEQNVVGRNTFYLKDQTELINELAKNNKSDVDNQLDDDAENIDYLFSYGDYGWMPQYLQEYARAQLPPMYRILIAGDFTSYNETRRMGLTRLNPDGSVDTSFLDTAFNQFAGLNRGTTTQATGLINSIAISSDQSQPRVFIAGNFDKVGGGDSRVSVKKVGNIASLASGETTGPGELTFENEEFTIDEDSAEGTIQIRRKNGRRGYASAIIETVSEDLGAGIASGGTIGDLEDADYFKLQKPIFYKHQSEYWLSDGTLDDQWYNTWYDYDRDFIDATYYTYNAQTYRALLPHGFEPAPGSNIYDKLPTQYLEDSQGQIILTYNEEDSLSPAFGFDGRGWQLQDGKDGLININLDTIPDQKIEGNETVKLRIAVPRGYVNLGGEYIPTGIALGNSESKLIIIDDDFKKGSLKFSAQEIYVNESDKTALIKIDRIEGLNGSISVQYRTKTGNASTPYDFKEKTGTIRFGSGQNSRYLYLNIVDDEIQESDEYFDIELFNVTGGGKLIGDEAQLSARVFIIDNDLKAGKVDFTLSEISISENKGEVLIPVARSGGSRGQGQVSYYTLEDTANAEFDYTSKKGTLSWADQDVSEKYIKIAINDDENIEERESFRVIIGDPTNVIIGSKNEIKVNIDDDDDPGVIEFSSSEYYINENGAELKIYIRRIGGEKGDVSADYMLIDGTAESIGELSDYEKLAGTINLESGVASASITIKVNDDFATENTEYFSVNLSNPKGGVKLGDLNSAKINIIDNETANVPAGSIDTFFDTGVSIRVNGPIQTIEKDELGNTYLAGEFNVINGIIRNGIAKLNSLGNLDSQFDVKEGANDLIRDINPLNEGSIIVAGDFNFIRGVKRNHIAVINRDGYLNTSFDPGSGFNGPVYKIEKYNDNFLIVGDFDKYQGQVRKGLVVINQNGHDVTPWPNDVGSSGAIFDSAVLNNNEIVLSGNFEQFSNNKSAQKIVKINGEGNVIESFTNNFSSIYSGDKFKAGKVNKILYHPDGSLLLLGDFVLNAKIGRYYRNIIKINNDGSLVSGPSESDLELRELAQNNFNIFNETYSEAKITYESLIQSNNALEEDYINNNKELNDAKVVSEELKLNLDNLRIIAENENSTEQDRLNYLSAKNDFESIQNKIIILELKVDDSGKKYLDNQQIIELETQKFNELTSKYDDLKNILDNSIKAANVLDFNAYTLDTNSGYINSEILDGQIQPDGKVVIVGRFTEVASRNRNRIARLTVNGDLDPTINFELGANNVIRTLEILNNYRILIGGDFDSFNGVYTPNIAKLYGGINYGGGIVSFIEPKIQFAENSGNKKIIFKRQLGLTTEGSFSLTISSDNANKWFPGLDPEEVYDYVGFSTLDKNAWPPEPKDELIIKFGVGEVFKEIDIISIDSVDEINNINSLRRSNDTQEYILYIVDDKFADEPDEELLLNISKFKNMNVGPQSSNIIVIENNDSAIKFSNVADDELTFNYYADESNQEGIATFTVERNGATNRVVTVDYKTRPGTAKNSGFYKDYQDVFGTINFGEGEIKKIVSIPLIDDFNHEGVESIIVELSNSTPKGSALIAGPKQIELLVDDSDKDLSRSVISFEYNNYEFDETDGKIPLKIIRYGDLSDISTVKYASSDLNALSDGPNADYESLSGQLVFKEGESEKIIYLNLIDDFDQESSEKLDIKLYDSVGSKLGLQATAKVKISDKEAGTVMFTKWNDLETDGLSSGIRNNTYFVTETEMFYLNRWYAGNSIGVDENDPKDGLIHGDDMGIRVTITRMEGYHGRIKFDYSTADGIAKAGEHYISQSGTITMESGQTHAHVIIPILSSGVWTDYNIDELGFITYETFNQAGFSLNLLNIRKDDGEPDYIKPQFKDENWNSAGQITATIVVERQPVINPYVSSTDIEPDLGTGSGTTYDGLHFIKKDQRVRESQGFADIQVSHGVAGGTQIRWQAVPSTPLGGVQNHDWLAAGYSGGWIPANTADNGGTNTPFIFTESPARLNVLMELAAAADYAIPWYPQSRQDLRPESENVTPYGDGDFYPIGGTLKVEPGSMSTLKIPIINNDEIDFNNNFYVVLWEQPGTDDCCVGRWPGDYPQITRVTIVADGDLKKKSIEIDEATGAKSVVLDNNPKIGEVAAGSYDKNFNPHSQYDTDPAYNFDPGANNQVHAVAALFDDSVLIGGDFTSFNSYPINRIGKLFTDGSVDKSFKVGSGADDTVTTIKTKNDGKILIGGRFKSYNGKVSYGVAQLNPDGSYDSGFNVGTGFDHTVRDIYVQDDNFVLISGEFTSYNNTNAVHLIRLDQDGNIDDKLKIKRAPNAPVNAVVSDQDGSIIAVGEFTKVGEYQRNYIVRYKADGEVDPNFESVEGANGIIHDVAIQSDGKIIIAGEFTRINFVERNRIARLNSDGTVDRSFNPGEGFDSTVYTIVIDKDKNRKIYRESGNIGGAPISNPDYLKIYAGGIFHQFDEVRRYGLTRLNSDGTLDTTFMDNSFNQFAGIPTSGEQDPRNFIKDISLTQDKDLYISGSFTKVGGGYNNFDKSPQNNITRIVGNKYGFYPNNGGFFVESGTTRGPGRIGFESDNYYADEFINSHFIKLKRDGGNLGAATVKAGTINPSVLAGSAEEDIDYVKNIKDIIYPTLWPVSNINSLYNGGWLVSDAFSGINNFGSKQDDLGITQLDGSFIPQIIGNTYFSDLNEWFIHINQDEVIEGNERIELSLYQPKSKLYLGGANMASGFALGKRTAFLTSIDDDFNHGTIRFAESTFYASEGETKIKVTLERVNGSNGQVSVSLNARDMTDDEKKNAKYDKANGSSVIADYIPRKVEVTFEPEETSKSVFISLINDTVREEDEAFILTLKEPKGGAVINGPFSNGYSVVVIVDNDYESGVITFSEEEYRVNEGSNKLQIPLNRIGGNQGRVSSEYRINKVTDNEEIEISTGRIEWANNNSDKRFIEFDVPNDEVVTNTQVFKINLFAASGDGDKTPKLGLKETLINVIETDRYGELSFAASDFYVSENGGEFVVTVLRKEGTSGEISVDYSIEDGTAKVDEDYLAESGTLFLEAGQPSATFRIQVVDGEESVDKDETVVLKLTNPQPLIDFEKRTLLGTPNIAVLNIIDNQLNNVPPGLQDTSFNEGAGTDDFVDTIAIQSDGKFIIGGEFKNVNGLNRSRIARLNENGQLDGAYNLGIGFDGPVRSIKIDESGKAIVVGYFNFFNGVTRNGIARLNEDGILDETFNPGGGADNPITDFTIQSDGKIIIVGDFTTFNGSNAIRIARINPDGSLDRSFNAGIGPNSTVNSVDVLSNGKIIIGGDFSTYNLVNNNGLMILNGDGSVYNKFDIGNGFNGSVKKVLAQPDLKILVCGLFTKFNDNQSNRIIRINYDGTIDRSFNIGTGANAAVYSMALQQDGKIVIGGDFNQFNGLNKNAIVRLNHDGTPDPTINFGTGANGSVLAVAIRSNYKLILGGGFTQFNNSDKKHIAQVHGGIIRTPGRLQFNFDEYVINEKGTNAIVTVVRSGGLMGDISTLFSTVDNTTANSATPGLDYTPLTTKLSFPEGEAIQNISLNIFDDIMIEDNEVVDLKLSEFTKGTEGLQSESKLIIRSDDSGVGFGSKLYSITEGQDGSLARIEIKRIGSLIGEVDITFLTATNGTAQATSDFQMVSNKIHFDDFETSQFINIPIVDDDIIEPTESVTLLLTNLLGNAYIQRDESKLNIVDNDFATGEFSFELSSYRALESANFATIGVVRTNGFTGIVEIDYELSDLTASAGKDYSSDGGSVVFSDGEFVQYIDIPIINDLEKEGAEAFKVRLTKASGDAIIVPPNFANVVILDDESEDFLTDISGQGANGPVYSIEVLEEGFLVGGSFDKINNIHSGKLAVFDELGSIRPYMAEGLEFNNSVFATEWFNNGLLIGGLFNKVGDNSVNGLVKADMNGNIDTAFKASNKINSTVFDIEKHNNNAYVGGSFGIIRIDSSGVSNEKFTNFDIIGSVYDIEIDITGIHIGGDFKIIGSQTENLAKIDFDGNLADDFMISESPDAPVFTISKNNGLIYVGGSFVTVNGKSQRRVACFNSNGEFNDTFDIGSGFDGTVRKIKRRNDGNLIIAGNFKRIAGRPANSIILLDQFGSVISDKFNKLAISDSVYDIDEIPGRLFAFGGAFKANDLSPYTGLAVVNSFTSPLPPELEIYVENEVGQLKIKGNPLSNYYLEFSFDLKDWGILQSFKSDNVGGFSTQIDLKEFKSQYFRAVSK